MQSFLCAALMIGLCILFISPTHAQLYTGSLTGVITDPSGAVVQNANVTLTDVEKGFKYNIRTNSAGRYLLRPIPPATYTLTVAATGFETYEVNGVKFDVNQNATIDASLRLKSSQQTVEVAGSEAPLLDTQDATTGQEVDRQLINDIPLVGRSVLDLSFLAPGINPTAGGAYGSGQNTNFSSNGGRNSTADLLIDGASATGPDNNGTIQDVQYVPSVDSVQEFKIMQNNFSAEFGEGGNTIVNLVMRSGTNTFHGSAYYFNRNSALDANNWFSNHYGQAIPDLSWNDYGGTFGGPIQRDKTFFFVDYEGYRQGSAAGPYQFGVPSALERTGDFGELCADDGGVFDTTGKCTVANGQIYDPYSAHYDPTLGGAVKSRFVPFNNLATYQSPGSPALNGTPYQVRAGSGNLIDPVSAKLMTYYPMPNLNVGSTAYNRFLNWTGTGLNKYANDQFDIRIDRRFGDRTSVDGRFSYGTQSQTPYSCYPSVMDPCNSGIVTGGPRSFVLNTSHTFSPTSLLALTFGFTRGLTHNLGSLSDPSFNLVKDLGFPGYLTSSGYTGPPQTTVYDYNSSLGPSPWNAVHSGSDVYQLTGSYDKVHGRQEWKVGGDWRVHRFNYIQPGPVNGSFGFGRGTTSDAPASGAGDAMASFLTGQMAGGGSSQYLVSPGQSTQNIDWAAFFQDNWRITDKLTLDLGVRYEVQIPRTERKNRLSWFDPNAVSPAQGHCVTSGVAGLPSQICLGTVVGGLEFAHSGDRHMAYTNYSNVGPRAALTYQFMPNTVLRAGYGLYFEPIYYIGGGGAGGTDGFGEWTYGVTTYQNDGATPYAPLSNPFPTGVNIPPGSSLGLATEIGQTLQPPIRSDNATPYMQTWSLGIQRELPGKTVLDMEYAGTKGTHLYFGGSALNHLGPFIEHASPQTIAAYNSYVPNPFYGVITDPTSPRSSPTIWAASLFSVPGGNFPQFNFVGSAALAIANSNYNALQVKLDKHMSNGLELMASYVWSKSIDNSSIGNQNAGWAGGTQSNVNPNNYNTERSVSEFDIPQVFTAAFTYQLPIGRGQHWGGGMNKLVNGFVGGWQLNGFLRIDDGQPLGPITEAYQNNPLPTYGQRPDLLAPLRRSGRSSSWFTVNSTTGYGGFFSNPQSAVIGAPYTTGTAPRMIATARAPGNNNTSLSLFKEFSMQGVRDGSRLEFRLETFNAFNHPVFCAPNVSVGSGQFGQVTGQCNAPRQVQLGMKFYF